MTNTKHEFWHMTGKLEFNGLITHSLNGKFHCDTGPAIIHKNGAKEWWVNGCYLLEEEFNQWLEKKNLNEKLESTLQPKPIQKRSKI